jgi:hypothetical protein
MGRRSTDLLDVFRPGGGSGAEPRREPAKKVRAPRSPRTPFEGFFLGPRQLILGSSVVVLLLVLSFTVGLGVGRKAGRGTDGVAPALSHATQTRTIWVVRGSLDRVDAATSTELSEERVLEEMGRRFPWLPRERVRLDVSGGSIALTVGPFRDEREAATFLETRLRSARLWSKFPFRLSKPESVRVPVR